MATRQMSKVVRQLHTTALLQEGAGLTDEQLVGCFIEHRDEAAFVALVRRHGPMVWGVCRRLLNHHDAEDAFQAVFLVLFRKAASIRPRGMLANWLYGVAHQTALQARRNTARRRAREKQLTEMPEPAAAEQDVWGDLRPLLDQELSRLPDKYRIVLVLCDLEGMARKEAARQLGLPDGTVASRLARARTMLAKRLTRRGVALSGGVQVVVLSQKVASACVPTSVVSLTIRAVTLVAAGRGAAAGGVSVKVAALTQGVIKTMLMNRLKVGSAVLLAAGVLTISTGTLLVPTAVGTAAGGVKDKAVHQAVSGRAGESRDVQLRIAGPVGMKVCVTAAGPGTAVPIEVPGRLNLEQGKLFRLKLTDIPNRPGAEQFPTVEIPRVNAAAESFVTSSAIPIEFTDDDFDHVTDGALITKVVYLKTGTKEPATIAS
jgi:RNA polymerase sigma factor (sigma-70 family)